MTRERAPWRLPAQSGEMIDRSRSLTFSWNGRRYSAHPGDTIVSALAASGERVFSRSFKYHRPRGLLTADYNDPGCMVQVGDEPNVRGAHRLVEQGMRVQSQNTWPSLRFDLKAVNELAGRFLSGGFYYKTFIKPQRLWPLYEKLLQRFVHGGEISAETPHAYHDKRHAHVDVLVAGGGPAGMSAALAAAEAGARVMLVEEDHHLGGHLRWDDPAEAARLADQLARTDGIELLADSAVLGRYDQNWLAVVQRNRPERPEHLIKVRAATLVAAPGLLERPYVFEGNDTPGVMLATAARRLINLHGVRPGRRAVVLSANSSGDAAVADLRRAGVEIAHVADARAGEDVVRVRGRSGVRSVELADGRRIEADLLVTATGWTAPTALLNMSGDLPVYSPRAARFVPGGTGEETVFAAGGLAGDGSQAELSEHARAVGAAAARRAASRRQVHLEAIPTRNGGPRPQLAGPQTQAIPELPLEDHPELFRARTHGLVDFSEDVSSKDLHSAVAEGYDSPELAKRYTTATMGPAQGKLETINTIAAIAEATGRTIAQTGTTTWRPLHAPTTLGALAGRSFEPVRYSPMQPWHEQHAAAPLVAGQWIRPDHYGDPEREVRTVRERVGIIDVTPIGKLDLRGPDVPKLLNLLYVNRWSKLPVGRVRYGVMCADDGVVFDDGVTGRLAEDHYLMSTTSSGAAAVWEWVENWLQTAHPDWQVHVTPVTTAYASINVAGPRSRELMRRLVDGVDLAPEAFGYMNVRTGRVAGVDECVLWRIGFTGELSYELHVPAAYGLHVWHALLEHGADLGVAPFGVEAQRILRLEKGHLIVGQDTDGLTKGFSAGIDWAIKLDKDDFVGKPELAWQHEHGDGLRLVGLQFLGGQPGNQPSGQPGNQHGSQPGGQLAPLEASQILRPDGRIAGRVTSSRYSPTLQRAIGLGQLEPDLAEPGTTLRIRLPEGGDTTARVIEGYVHVDPEGTRNEQPDVGGAPQPHTAPVARSAIPTSATAGSERAEVLLADHSLLGKITVKAPHDGKLAAELGTRFGRTTRDGSDNLVAGSGPSEWFVLAAQPDASALLERLRAHAGEAGEFVTVLDATHGRALFRLSGLRAAEVLAKVCDIDFADDCVPNGAALRTSVAAVVTDLIRDDLLNDVLIRDESTRGDEAGTPSYLLHCERSSGAYLFEAVHDAGGEFGVAIADPAGGPAP